MLRIKVELVPHGVEAEAETLDTILIANDGTRVALGEDEGGIGNYEVFDNETLEHLHTVDYPHMYACGFIKGVERTPTHRLFLAEQALGIAQEARTLDTVKRGVPRPVRDFEAKPKPKMPPDSLNIP